MRRNFFRCGMLCMLASSMMLTSCLQEEDIVEMVEDKYNKSWVETFGAIDPEHDFNTAMGVTANIDLTGLPTDEYEVQIYTTNPTRPNCYRLAKGKVKDIATFNFDVEKIQENVFVTAKGKNGMLVHGYYDIVNKEVTVNTNKQSSRADGEDVCNTTQGDEYPLKDDPSTKFTRLKDVSITEATTYLEKDDFDAVINSTNGILKEGGNNLTTYQNILNTDINFKMAEDGPITMNFRYMITSGQIQFGYFYYTDEMTNNLSNVKKYIINPSEDYVMNNYLKVSLSWDNGNTWSNYDNISTGIYGNTYRLMGSDIKLAYFGENGENTTGSYIFPKGTNIGFFIINHGKKAGTFYSMPQLHEDIDKKAHAATFKYNGVTYLGFEDFTQDYDLNDILFFVNGNFDESNQTTIKTEEVKENAWLFTCEDLGSIGDYDFNDVVFSVSNNYDQGSGQSTLTITPLAAGGTLPVQLFFDNKEIGKEFHSMFNNAATNTPINVGSTITHTADPITLNIDGTFSVSNKDDLKRFKVKVNGKTESIIIVKDTSKDKEQAPQMILLPNEWEWPLEGVNMSHAYEHFPKWTGDANSFADWYKYNITNKVTKRK